MPKIRTVPKGLQLFRKKEIDGVIDSIEDITLIPEKDRGKECLQFEPIPFGEDDDIGGDVSAAIFSTKDEAEAFYAGIEHANPGDDVTYAVETIKLPARPGGQRLLADRTVYAVLMHWGDSSSDEFRLL